MGKSGRGSKYNAIPETVDGVRFSSQLEATTYRHLRKQEHDGEIEIREFQPVIYLSESRIKYRSDFRIFDFIRNEERLVEAKGAETDRWRVVLGLYRSYGLLPLDIYKSRGGGIKLVERVEPTAWKNRIFGAKP